ncbi:MAG: hypothetical protein AAB922_06450 [Patescibacteria group bacterium]
MSTLLQKELAQNIVKNAKSPKRKNKKDLLVSTGYAISTAESEARLILESKGVQGELKALGFDEDSAKQVVGEILLDDSVEPQHRIKAASEIFKVSGSYAPEKHVNYNVTPIYAGESVRSIHGHNSDEKDIQAEKEDSRG